MDSLCSPLKSEKADLTQLAIAIGIARVNQDVAKDIVSGKFICENAKIALRCMCITFEDIRLLLRKGGKVAKTK